MAWADRPPLHRAAMSYCGPRGIPLSVFLGRTVYPGQPQWLDEDREAALEWQAELCPGCGQPKVECWADEEVAPSYDTDVIRCWSCEAIGQEQNVIRNNKAAGSGLYVLPRKVEV